MQEKRSQLVFPNSREIDRKNLEIAEKIAAEVRNHFFRIFEFYSSDCLQTPSIQRAKEQITWAFENFERNKGDMLLLNKPRGEK